MDFLISHSSDSEILALSFYGGEPLLRFGFIKKCVEYMDSHVCGKEILYNITTNGTIMSEEIARFLIDYGFIITFSLDGPKEIHDNHRKLAQGEKGSFDVLMRSVQMLKDLHPDYQKKVQFNCVVDVRNDLDSLATFLCEDSRINEDVFNLNFISDDYTSERLTASDSFVERTNYEHFKALLNRLGKIPADRCSILAGSKMLFIQNRLFRFKSTSDSIGVESHHSGPCIPGKKRLFVNADGDFYPCERVSECSVLTKMGNIEAGIDIEKAERILNIERESHEKCKDCWAYRHCSSCIRSVDGITGFSNEEMERTCIKNKASMEESFKDYCVLKKLGCDFFRERADELAGTEEGWR